MSNCKHQLTILVVVLDRAGSHASHRHDCLQLAAQSAILPNPTQFQRRGRCCWTPCHPRSAARRFASLISQLQTVPHPLGQRRAPARQASAEGMTLSEQMRNCATLRPNGYCRHCCQNPRPGSLGSHSEMNGFGTTHIRRIRYSRRPWRIRWIGSAPLLERLPSRPELHRFHRARPQHSQHLCGDQKR